MTSGDWNAAIEADLLPCWHCGATEQSPIESVVHLCHNEWHPEHNPEGDWWTVQCDGCTATMGRFGSPDEAITAWNTRQPTTPTTGEDDVERAKRFLAVWYDWNGEPGPWWDAIAPEDQARATRAALAAQEPSS